jgi:hemolysin activation/secretion protein
MKIEDHFHKRIRVSPSYQIKREKSKKRRFYNFRIGMVVLVFIWAAIVLSCSPLAWAQEVLGLDPTVPPGDRLQEIYREKPPAPPPSLLLPPSPLPKREVERLPLKSVFVRMIVVTGSTVFSPEELAEVTSPFVNRELTNEDLEALRRDLTVHYIDKGYVSSGAIIPDQNVVDGVITVKIIEGRLTRIEVEGNKWFGDTFIQDRLALGAGPPVNIISLQKRLQLLQQNKQIKLVNAELRPDVKPGENVLKIHVEEKNPFKIWLGFNNYMPPSIGGWYGQLAVANENLTGRGDILSFTYGRSEGLKPQIDTWYSLPITARDTTFTMRYRKNDFYNVSEPFQDLDIESESDIYGLTLRHPFYRTLNQEFAMALTGENLRNKNYLLGEPFSFSLGEEAGKSVDTAIRFSQEWTYRTQQQVIAARSTFNFGIDALDATIRKSGLPDGKFFSWLGQFQWATVLKPWDVQVLFRTDSQLSNDPLLPLEQIAVGGRYTVRGYRENLLVRDQALIASLESRIPIIRNKPWADYLQLVPFIDYGRAWNKELRTPSPKDIWSIGLGLRWGTILTKSPVEVRAEFEFYWGYALKNVDTGDEYDLQDDGIHFQFVITGF